jgi:hypothetical protein
VSKVFDNYKKQMDEIIFLYNIALKYKNRLKKTAVKQFVFLIAVF